MGQFENKEKLKRGAKVQLLDRNYVIPIEITFAHSGSESELHISNRKCTIPVKIAHLRPDSVLIFQFF